MTIRLRTLAIAASLLLVLGGAGAGLVVWLGLYDISASDQHTAPVYRVLDYAMRRSVMARTRDSRVPDLADAQRVSRGAAHYREHCVQCHGGPGAAPDALAMGMTPAPASLVGTARAWKPAEMFWVVKHGVKMSGMPSWQYRMTDEEIWDTIAFVAAMPRMTARDYATLTQQAAPHRHQREHGAGEGAMPAAPRGDPAAGRRAAHHYQCATCHVIPGVVGADRHVGPPLTGMGTRRSIGGVVSNTPDNMVRWLQNPQQFDPLSAMPALGLAERDARDIAAFLATLDDVH
ncbi:MAG TPA: c-type cytochrome [Ramlibacter sp.]